MGRCSAVLVPALLGLFVTSCGPGDPQAGGSGGGEAGPSATAPAASTTDTVDGTTFAAYVGDAGRGANVFSQCSGCHSVDPGANRIGPSLHAIVGRKAGTVAGFRYSPANAASDIKWTEAKLFQFLENPQRVMPGTRMMAGQISDPQKRADLIAYLATLK